MLRALTAYLVCIVFLTTIASPLIAARAPLTSPPAAMRIAVGPCVDNSRSVYGDLSTEVATAAQVALASSGAYQVVSLETVPAPERVLHVALEDISDPAGARQMQVTVAAQLRSGASGELICSAAAVSSGLAAPARVASPRALVRAAVSTGVQTVVSQVTQAAEITGVVTGTGDRDKVGVNLGRTAGIRAGAELAIYRNGKYLATIEVRSVRHRGSTGVITDIKAGTTIRGGDDVRVVSIPAKAPKKRRGKGKRSAVITGLIVLAGVGLLTAINSWGGHTTPTTNVEDPLTVTSEEIIADGSDSIIITAIVSDPDGNPVRNDTPILFRITAGRGQLDGGGAQVQARTAEGAATTTLTTVDETSPPIVVTAIPQKGAAGLTPFISVVAPP
jgi:hypothetical protein